MFVCIRYGTFYHIYNRDCYILSYLFGYKIKELNIKDRECGFPITAFNKVMAKLEEKKINYLVLDRRNNYEVNYKEDFKNSNQYDILYKKANRYVNYKKRIDNINEFLNSNIENTEISKIIASMEDIIYERRKVQSN